MSSLKEVVFWGGTGQAKVLNEALDSARYRLSAVIDNRQLEKPPVNDVLILHGIDELNIWLDKRGDKPLPFAAVAIGGNRGKDRLELMNILRLRGLNPLNILHRKSFIAKDSILGEGVQVLAMAAVCSQARIGNSVIINTSASVDHDSIIEDGVHIAPGARLAGEVCVSKYAFIGTGAIILPRVNVGEGAVVGAGAVVTKDVPPYVTVVGTPARIKNN